MTECERCGPVHDGAELQETAAGPLCLSCLDWMQERGTTTRAALQRSLDDYAEGNE